MATIAILDFFSANTAQWINALSNFVAGATQKARKFMNQIRPTRNFYDKLRKKITNIRQWQSVAGRPLVS